MNRKCGWTEEEVVDFIMGNLSEPKAYRLQQHMDRCKNCQDRYGQWQEIVDNKQKTAAPSPMLKKRIDKSVDSLPQRKKKKRPAVLASAMIASIAIIILLIGSGLSTLLTPSQEHNIVKQNEDIEYNEIINDPQTSEFEVLPTINTHQDQIKGNIWINDRTNEMFMEVEGLTELEEKDYQLWLIDPNERLHDELLQIRYGSNQLYYKGPEMNQVKWIIVSIEPKGGSHTPTGPETFSVDLSR
ncbi:anti-sigma factor [Alteribacillus bidgolensis]|uniref:Transmembrane transcriptional regulator (Anti-sigma factor RsiW) n=1 Tax=Alteribacillus bidgolensis TaxID=930129 RepID=A0A1G8QK68_9BACI|nr:anti-sigma factor [Alteribacillus bidgolensis]SDJ05046.1 Transmembrane transcriptional regulator (anti-sigma factor RsiW) [Alteribacillus bidgolensis]